MPRSIPRPFLVFGTLSLSIPLVLGACKRAPDSDKTPVAAAAADAPSMPAVRFTKVIEQSLPPTLEVSGTLAADESSEVAAPGAGIVQSVEIDVGSRVKKGDVLVRIDGRDASLRLAQANAARAQAQARLGMPAGQAFDPKKMAEVRAAKEAMDLAVTDADRTKTLFDSGGVPQAQWDAARARAEQARAQYDAALNGAQQAWAGLAAADAQANLAQKAVSDTVIRAPFDGAVAERRISVGEFCQVGKVVAVVVQQDPLRLRVDVPEADAGQIAEGREVTVSVAAYPGRTFRGTVKRIGASIKAQTRALPIEAEVQNPDGALKPGTFARALIALGGAERKALLVPRGAVGTSGSASRVFVRAGTRVIERIVTVGRENDGNVEVRGTLAANDEVATTEVDKLSDGAEIKVTP
ncbi:MAG: efflux RND transporter periplasmic adaptor subunit [Byssovorax sp.]